MAFSYNASKLQAGGTYYYRAAAFADGANTYGQYSTFRTATSSGVSISTNPAASISTTAATLNAYMNAPGNSGPVQVWFRWGNNPDFGNTTSRQSVAAAVTVSAQLVGLNPGTEYYCEAVAEAPDGTKAFGGQSVFTTVSGSGGNVTVTTSSATNVSGSAAQLNGTLDQLGSASSVQVWFEYGTTAQYGSSTEVRLVNRPGPFSVFVTGLAPGRNYYYRALALVPTAGGQSVHGPATSFATTGTPVPPGPEPGIPAFIWLIGVGLVIIIIILAAVLARKR
jgi:hypothetical protein